MSCLCYTFTSRSVQETLELGSRIGAGLLAGDVVAIAGDLGAGKTHLCKGIAHGLGADMDLVNSPTFVLLQQYAGRLPIFHFDTYRLSDVTEFEDIGGLEILEQAGISLVEWPQKVFEILPVRTIWIELTATAPDSRSITFRPNARGDSVVAQCRS